MLVHDNEGPPTTRSEPVGCDDGSDNGQDNQKHTGTDPPNNEVERDTSTGLNK